MDTGSSKGTYIWDQIDVENEDLRSESSRIPYRREASALQNPVLDDDDVFSDLTSAISRKRYVLSSPAAENRAMHNMSSAISVGSMISSLDNDAEFDRQEIGATNALTSRLPGTLDKIAQQIESKLHSMKEELLTQENKSKELQVSISKFTFCEKVMLFSHS
jgi:hypothetical protein